MEQNNNKKIGSVNPGEETSVSPINVGFLVKQFFYLMLAFALTFGIYLFEAELSLVDADSYNPKVVLSVEGNNRVELRREGSETLEVFTKSIDLSPGDILKTNTSSNVTIKFPSDAVIRLDEDTEMKVLVLKPEELIFRFSLEKGQAWVNNIYNGSDLRLVTGGMEIDPERAIVNVHRIGNQVDLHVLNHQVKVSFVGDGGEFLNDLFVSEGNKILAQLDKLDPVLSKLFYSKLIKEFKYGLFNDSILNEDSWFKENGKKDQQLRTVLVRKEIDHISQIGLKYPDIDSFYFELGKSFDLGIRSKLTFSKVKKDDLFVDMLFGHIDDAIYLAEVGQFDEALRRLEYFESLRVSNDFAFLSNDIYRAALEKRLDTLIFASPGDHLYLVKEYLLRQRLLSSNLDGKEDFAYLQYYLDDVYDAARNDFGQARSVLRTYFSTANDFLNVQVTDADSYIKNLQIQNHFLENLFVRYPVFYTKEFFKEKEKLEDAFLAVLPSGDVEKEERQSLINKKIDLLKRLQFFFFDEKVVLSDARDVVRLLVSNIEDLLPANTPDVAVQDFFKKSVGDFNLFLGYLNNDEFAESSYYGATHELRFQAYLKQRDSTQTVLDLREALFGSGTTEVKASAETRDDIIRQVKKDFAEFNANQLQFANDLKAGDRHVTIEQGVMDGYKFKGIYDRDAKVISNVVVGGNLLSKSGIRLKNLQVLIKSQFDDLGNIQEGLTEDVIAEDKLTQQDRLLLLLFTKKMSQYGFSLSEENVRVLSVDVGAFRVVGLEVPEHPEALYSFDVFANSDLATNISIVTLKHQVQVNDDAQLDLVGMKVQDAYEKYVETIEESFLDSEVPVSDAFPVPGDSSVDSSPVKVPRR